MVPAYASAAALLYVACVMARGLAEIDWEDITEYAPAVVTAITMPLTYSIATGIGLGFITYALAKVIGGQSAGGLAGGGGVGDIVRNQICGGGMNLASSWQFWAVLSAVFAALTAIFAKVGVENVNSDFATFIRTIVILATLAFILLVTGQFQSPGSISSRTYLFLLLSGLATGASWICYFRALKIGEAAKVAPIDKLSVVLVAMFGVLFLGEKLTAPNWLGVALIAVGAILVAYR